MFFRGSGKRNSVDGEKQIDPAYFDNIAIDTTGENLTTPPVDDGFGMWGPWEIVDAAGNVIQGRFVNGEPDGTILVTEPDGTQSVTEWKAGGTQ